MAQPLVLLHGFTHTGASWEGVIAALPERYRPIALDIRGHGNASARRPVSLPAVIDDIASADPSSFSLVGYSMGGRIALHAALALGDRVDRLILIGASPGLDDPGERAQRRAEDERLADEIDASSIESFAERWARTPVLAGLPEDVAAAVHADRLRNTPAGLAAALRGLGTGALEPVWDRLGELRMPVTLIVGARDAKFRAVAERMADAIPGAAVEVVAGSGHAVHLEAPPAVAAALINTTRPARRRGRAREGR
jgi:2-succinyl-6-hydroxy-2,4-cyclohexadiene-1-carboxylate synthase